MKYIWYSFHNFTGSFCVLLVKTLINDWNTKIVNQKQQYPRDKAPLNHLKHTIFFNVVFVVCALKLKGFYATCEVMQRISCYIDY